jgi:hypothetical protein
MFFKSTVKLIYLYESSDNGEHSNTPVLQLRFSQPPVNIREFVQKKTKSVCISFVIWPGLLT